MKTITIHIPTSHSEVEFETISANNVRAGFGHYDGFGVDDETAFYDLITNMPDGPEMKEQMFPNGFDDWHETHYVISAHLAETKDFAGTIASACLEQKGTGGLWELAKLLTDEFEEHQRGRYWDGDWLDELEEWLTKKDNQ